MNSMGKLFMGRKEKNWVKVFSSIIRLFAVFCLKLKYDFFYFDLQELVLTKATLTCWLMLLKNYLNWRNVCKHRIWICGLRSFWNNNKNWLNFVFVIFDVVLCFKSFLVRQCLFEFGLKVGNNIRYKLKCDIPLAVQ